MALNIGKVEHLESLCVTNDPNHSERIRTHNGISNENSGRQLTMRYRKHYIEPQAESKVDAKSHY